MLPEDVLYRLNPWWESRAECPVRPLGLIRQKHLNQLDFDSKRIVLVQGSRRIGKSTFLNQVAFDLIEKGVAPEKILYLPIDHNKLNDKSFFSVVRKFRTRFSHPLSERLYILLDEIQDNPDWIIELKNIYDSENIKFICSGSHTALLDSEGSKLTGRYLPIIFQPFEYEEYLALKKINIKKSESYLHVNEVRKYLDTGGYPEMILGENIKFLKNLINDITERDIINRYRINKPFLLKNIFCLLIKSAGSPVSYNKIANVLKTTVDTVKEYIYYFKKCFIVNDLHIWSWSENDKIYNADKIYPLDTAFLNFEAFSNNYGQKAELAVFSKLKNQNNLGYYKINGSEVDFAYGDFENITLVESKFTNDLSLKDPKLNAVKKALHSCRNKNIKRVLIITDDLEKIEIYNGIECVYIPLYKFLMQR